MRRKETKMDMMMCVGNKARAAAVDPCEGCITICNECALYNRGECCWTGMPMTPDDYCSRAVKAE